MFVAKAFAGSFGGLLIFWKSVLVGMATLAWSYVCY